MEKTCKNCLSFFNTGHDVVCIKHSEINIKGNAVDCLKWEGRYICDQVVPCKEFSDGVYCYISDAPCAHKLLNNPNNNKKNLLVDNIKKLKAFFE